MTDRNSGVSLEYIIAVREYEFYFAVSDKCLSTEFFAVNELLNNKIIGTRVGLDRFARVIELRR